MNSTIFAINSAIGIGICDVEIVLKCRICIKQLRHQINCKYYRVAVTKYNKYNYIIIILKYEATWVYSSIMPCYIKILKMVSMDYFVYADQKQINFNPILRIHSY